MDIPRFAINEFLTPQSKQERQAEMKDQYESSKKRLEECRKRDGQKPLIDNVLLTIYGETKTNVDQLTEVDKEAQARKHIYQDLLVTTLFQPNGEPSDLNLKIAHSFNIESIEPDDYEPLPKNWNASNSILKDLAPIDYNRPDPYSGNLKILENNKSTRSEDSVERYALKFTNDGQSPAAIALPFSVDLGYSVRIDNNAGDFVEPFGGASCAKIVFLKKTL